MSNEFKAISTQHLLDIYFLPGMKLCFMHLCIRARACAHTQTHTDLKRLVLSNLRIRTLREKVAKHLEVQRASNGRIRTWTWHQSPSSLTHMDSSLKSKRKDTHENEVEGQLFIIQRSSYWKWTNEEVSLLCTQLYPSFFLIFYQKRLISLQKKMN